MPRLRSGRSVALVFALIAAGCSGDDDDDADASTTTVATTVAPSVEPPGSTQVEEPPEVAFTFGVLEPDEGPLTELAVGQLRGLSLAIDDINDGGGVLGGSVETVRAAESVDATLQTTVEALTADGADAILGPVGSASAVTIAALAREQALLVCSATATAPSVTAGGFFGTFFRTVMRDDDTSNVVAERIMRVAEEGVDPPGRVMVLAHDDVYGTELASGLAAQLTARGATVDTQLYPARRVEFVEEVAAVLAADPEVLVVAGYGEGLTLISQLDEAGFPVERIVGLDGLSFPDLPQRLFPDDPARADGLRLIRSTGDRALAARLSQVPGDPDGTLYAAQMYDCAVTIALAATAAGSPDPVNVGAQIQAVTSGGRACSTFAHCRELLDAGEGISYAGASGRLEISDEGDISSTRLTTSTVIDGVLVDTASDEIDLVAERAATFFSSAIVTTQLQQVMKALGYYDGDITGTFDDATAEALRAMQAGLGVPVTGELDDATDAALRARLGAASSAFSASVSQLQLELQTLGYYDGPIDGRYSGATTAAVRAFQARLGVPQTGLLDVATVRAIYLLGQQNPLQPAPPPVAQPTPPAPPTPEATPPPPDPVPPTNPPPPAVTQPAAAPPTPTTAPAVELPTMWAALQADGRFSTLVGLLSSVGFDQELDAPGPPFTVFAPTNAAFDAMDPAEREEWTGDPERLSALLAYHAVPSSVGVLQPADLSSGPLPSVHGTPLTVAVTGGATTVDGGLLDAPLSASNGIVYPIDTVLVPPV